MIFKETKDYRIHRLQMIHDLITFLAEQEPQLIDLTDWHSNEDALIQMVKIIENEEA